MVPGLPVAGCGRFPGETGNLIGPDLFRAYALFDKRFDAVADRDTRILFHGAFHGALIVVNEQAAQVSDRARVFFSRNSRLLTSALAVQTPSVPWFSTGGQPGLRSTLRGSFLGGAAMLA